MYLYGIFFMILVIVAHPDDEVLTCGAYISYIARRKDVYIVSMTHGTNVKADQIQKKSSMIKACKHLGVKESNIKILDLPDQGIQNIPQIELNMEIEAMINEITPEMIITHTDIDLNTDHITLNHAVKVSTRQKNIKVLFFESMYTQSLKGGRLNFYFNADDYFDKKMEAVSYYRDYLKNGYDLRSIDAIECLARLRGHYIGARYAEAFTIYKSVDMG